MLISKCATWILYSMMHLCRYANQQMCNVHTVFRGYLDFNQCFESVKFDPIIWPDPHPTIGLSLKKKIMKLLVREFSFLVTILFKHSIFSGWLIRRSSVRTSRPTRRMRPSSSSSTSGWTTAQRLPSTCTRDGSQPCTFYMYSESSCLEIYRNDNLWVQIGNTKIKTVSEPFHSVTV